MQINLDISLVEAKARVPWFHHTLSIRGFSLPVKVEFVRNSIGRELEYIRADVEKQVVQWLTEQKPIKGAFDWRLVQIWAAIH